jgi:hypothetical protein
MQLHPSPNAAINHINLCRLLVPTIQNEYSQASSDEHGHVSPAFSYNFWL